MVKETKKKKEAKEDGCACGREGGCCQSG